MANFKMMNPIRNFKMSNPKIRISRCRRSYGVFSAGTTDCLRFDVKGFVKSDVSFTTARFCLANVSKSFTKVTTARFSV